MNPESMRQQLEPPQRPDPDYRQILLRELEGRRRKNIRYSLRSFARDLQMSPSQLSEILSRKRSLSFQRAHAIADHLHLPAKDKEAFPWLVQMQTGRSPGQKALAKVRWQEIYHKPDYQLLKEDVFAVIADWYHLALLELITLDDCQFEIPWLARQLAIKPSQVDAALQRLLRLKMIRPGEKRRWVQNLTHSTTTDDIPSLAIQKFHRQISERFQRALSEQSVEEREAESFVMAIDREQLPELKKHLRRLVDDFMGVVNQMKKKDTVYAFSLQLFRLLAND